MSKALECALALKPHLRRAIYAEWSCNNFFPCYASIQLHGDPTVHNSDLVRFLLSRTDPFLRLSALLLWPFRAQRLVSKPLRDGIAFPVRTHSKAVLRFHTFFTDFYFYGTVRRILQAPHLAPNERQQWERILVEMVELVLQNQRKLQRDGQEFATFQFFPQSDLRLDGSSSGARFLRLSGLTNIDADADDTFVLLEMFADVLALLQAEGLTGVSAERQKALITAIEEILRLPYWQLARWYQFRLDGKTGPAVNYTSVEAMGGVSTWLGQSPEDTPDLVVNVNVLRSLLVNRWRWKVWETDKAAQLFHGMIDFLHRNVASGLFRTGRGYSFYIPEFFGAMFAKLWRAYLALDPWERERLDPDKQLDAVRAAVLDYVAQDLHPALRNLNPLDAALAMTTTIQLGQADATLLSRWAEVICDRFQEQTQPYGAYEIFKGKLPTHMVYGSEATTATFVYEALDELEAWLI